MARELLALQLLRGSQAAVLQLVDCCAALAWLVRLLCGRCVAARKATVLQLVRPLCCSS